MVGGNQDLNIFNHLHPKLLDRPDNPETKGRPELKSKTTNDTYSIYLTQNHKESFSLPYVTLQIACTNANPITQLALHDSGANLSCIDYAWYLEHAHLWPTMQKTKFTSYGAANTAQKGTIIGTLRLQLTLHATNNSDITFWHTFYIAKNLSKPIILGFDILGSKRTVFSSSNILMLKDLPTEEVPILINEKFKIYPIPIVQATPELATQLLTTEPHQIPPKSKLFINTMLKQASEQTPGSKDQFGIFALETNSVTVNHIQITEMAVTLRSYSHIPLLVTNYSDQPLTIDENTHIADLELITVDEKRYKPLPITIPEKALNNNKNNRRNLTEKDLIDVNLVNVHTKTKLQDFIVPPPENEKSHADMSQVEEQIEIEEFLTKHEKTLAKEHFSKFGYYQPTASTIIEKDRLAQSLDDTQSKEDTEEEIVDKVRVEHLSPKIQKDLRSIMVKNIKAFAKSDLDVGTYNGHKANINLKSKNARFHSRYIPIPAGLRKEVRQVLSKYLKAGVLRYVNEPTQFVSNLLITKKKSGKIRALLDARAINAETKKDSNSLMTHAEVLNALSSKYLRTSLDVSNAYFQIPLTEEAQLYTSFYDERKRKVCFTRCPQGCINSSSMLDDVMAQILGHVEGCLWYMDDALICSDGKLDNPEDVSLHLVRIDQVLKSFITYGMKIRPDKLNILTKRIEFLGIIYDCDKMTLPEARILAFTNYKKPTSLRQVRGLIGAASYYRKWVQRFADVVAPMQKLIKDNKFKWGKQQDDSFDKLIELITQDVTLNIPPADATFICHSDASGEALAFTASYEEDGVRKTFAHLSKTLSTTERAYSTIKKEVMAIHWGLSSLNFWLLGRKIIIYTDSKSILFLRTCKDTSSFLTRLAIVISQFDVEIRHLSSEENLLADMFSRNHKDAVSNTNETITKMKPMSEAVSLELLGQLTIPHDYTFTTEKVRNMLQADSLPHPKQDNKKRKASKVINTPGKSLPSQVPRKKIKLPTEQTRRPRSQLYPTIHELEITPNISSAREQIMIQPIAVQDPTDTDEHTDTEQDPPIQACCQDNRLGNSCEHIPSDHIIRINEEIICDGTLSVNAFIEAQAYDAHLEAIWLKERDKTTSQFKKFQGILCHKNSNGQIRPVLPDNLIPSVINFYHYSTYGGHRALKPMLDSINQKFYIQNAEERIGHFVKSCFLCQIAKVSNRPKYEIKPNLKPTSPRQFWSVDVTSGLPELEDGFKCIHIWICQFSNYIIAIPATSREGKDLLHNFIGHIVRSFGIPYGIRSDNEKGIVAYQQFQTYLAAHGIAFHPTNAHSPQTNGLAENAVAKVKQFIRTLCIQYKEAPWCTLLPYISMALNRTPLLRSTYTPEQIMFGAHIDSPLALLQQRRAPTKDTDEYYEQVKNLFTNIHDKIKRLRQAHIKRSTDYKNKTRRASIYNKDDLVFLRESHITPASNYKKKWSGQYRIMEIAKHGNTVALKHINSNKIRVAHVKDIKHVTHLTPTALLNPQWERDITNLVTQAQDSGFDLETPPERRTLSQSQ